MSQITSLSYVTAGHSNHDKCWLLQGVSNPLFCFACAIEGLESKDVLNVRKRAILMELLEVVSNTRPIWKVLTSKLPVHRHILGICFKLLQCNIDIEFQQLLVESIILFAKRINQDSSFNFVLDMLLSAPQFLHQPTLVYLLNKFVETMPSAVESIVMKKNTIIEMIIKAASSCKVDLIVPLWNLLSTMLCQCYDGISLPNVAVKTLLQSSTDAFNSASSSEGLQLTLFSVFKSFLTVPQLRNTLLVHETSEFTPQSRSLIEIVKKSLLSKSTKIQTAAIETIINITDEQNIQTSPMSTLSSVVINAGVSEYLFELFTCNNEETLKLLFLCVKGLLQYPSFFKQGHLTYGVSPIIQSLKSLIDSSRVPTLINGLELLTCLFENLASQNICFMGSSSATSNVLEVLSKSLMVNNDHVKLAVASCLEKYLNHLKGLRKNELMSKLFSLIEILFSFTLKTEKSTAPKQFKISMGLKSCLILWHFTRHLKQNKKDEKEIVSSSETIDDKLSSSKSQEQSEESQKSNDMNLGVFYLADSCLIPMAVSSLLSTQNMDYTAAFYQMLLAVMELSSEEGEALARKLARSSFIRYVTDFRISSRSVKKKELDETLSKLQYYFCIAMEDESIGEEDKQHLLLCLSKFTIPLKEWKLLLIQNQSNDMSLIRSRSCILALLAYSLKSKDPLLPSDALLICLQQLAADANLLKSLSMYSKRLFLYLWVNCESSCKSSLKRNLLARENIIKLLSVQHDHVDKLYMHCDLYFPFFLRLNLPMMSLVSVAKKYLSYLCKDKYEVAEAKLTKVMENIILNGSSNIALEVIVHVLSSTKNKVLMQISSHFLLDLMESNTDESWITFMKKTLHKVLLADCEKMDPENMAALFSILNHNRFFSKAIISTEDMKLFCRALLLCNSAPLSQLQLEVVNFLYALLVIASQKGDSQPFSIFMNNASICKDFEKQVFLNKNLKAFVTGSNLIERIVSATMLLVTQALKTYHQFNMAELSDAVIKIEKPLLLDALCWSHLSLLQISVVLLLTSYFEIGCKTSFISLVDTSGGFSQMTDSDTRLIFMAIQNLLINPSSLISRVAAKCFSALVKKINSVQFVSKQPWNSSIFKYSLSAMSNDETREGACTVLSCLLEESYGVSQSKEIQASISSLIDNNLSRPKLEVLCPTIESFLLKCLAHMSETELKDFLKHLKTLFGELMRRSLEDNTKYSTFDVMNGVLVHLEDDISLISHQGSVQRSISMAKKRVEELEDIADIADNED